jgi:hypothetical protein
VAEYVGTVILTAPASAFGKSKPAPAPPKTTITATTTPPKQTPPVSPPGRPKRTNDPGEQRAINQFHRDFAQKNLAKSMEDLDDWTRRFPQSDFADDRLYDYMQVHSMAGRPDKVLEFGAALISKDLAGISDEQEKLGVLYLVTVNAAAIPHPTNPQRALGKETARALMETLPAYFEESRRPAGTDDADWRNSRRRLETAARNAIKTLGAPTGM